VQKLDLAEFERARLARDARYDGRFFTAVITTGVYCRPICPARPPKRSNVRYFLSAAAADKPDSVHACAAVRKRLREALRGREREPACLARFD
jgi:AraC family transcriptional regulator of adaptative response / DNA-3-methyladenine glycosylase II